MHLLFDIGGTKMRLAVSADLATLGQIKIVPTPAEPAALARAFKKLAGRLLGRAAPLALAGGLTRRHQAVAPLLSQIFDAPLYLENDSALCGLGEALDGAGRGAAIVAYITVSTGVGGARIVAGRIDHKTVGFEPGRQIINWDGQPQTLEGHISGRALEAKYRQLPKLITDPAVWAELARPLAIGLHNTIMHWSPERVVLGGSMIMGTPRIEIEATAQALAQISTIFPTLPPLVPAALADLGGLHGALHFLRQNLKT